MPGEDANFQKAVLYMWKSVQTGNTNNIQALLSSDLPVDTPLTDGGMTGLHIAWSRGDLDSAKILNIFIISKNLVIFYFLNYKYEQY